jgi:hypothetical protein
MRDLFYRAFEQFIAQESANIANSTSERNFCGRLAIYLEDQRRAAQLGGYYVDPEYNRQQNGRIKAILDGNMQEVEITCDLILHSRGENIRRDNLIAIEMKKSDRPESEKDKDRVRLRALTKATYDDVWSYNGVTLPEYVCGYELGVFVEIDVRSGLISVQEFEHGNMTRERQFELPRPARV